MAFEPEQNPYLVPFDGSFSVSTAPTGPAEELSKKSAAKKLARCVDRLGDLQRMLYAQDKVALLLIFQAMDAAGKDSTIRAVMSGVNPAGCQVFSFKKPSAEELDHDFLWRTVRCLPERGRIGIFNRSYYEEVLIVKVHPEILGPQRVPQGNGLEELFQDRYDSIRDHERHLARNGTVILKFWLNVSPEVQKERFLARLDRPEKNWKFASGDVEERSHWDVYMSAYQRALNETSRPWAPWYAIPADNKPAMRLRVAEIVVQRMESMGLAWPALSEEARSEMAGMRARLVSER